VAGIGVGRGVGDGKAGETASVIGGVVPLGMGVLVEMSGLQAAQKSHRNKIHRRIVGVQE